MEHRAVEGSPHTTSNVKRRRTSNDSRTKREIHYQVQLNLDHNSLEEYGMDSWTSSAAQTELRIVRRERDVHGELGAAATRTR